MPKKEKKTEKKSRQEQQQLLHGQLSCKGLV
jgi:hypothetical protein